MDLKLFISEAFVETVPLACYVLFVFFAFCDGFKLHPARKIFWAVFFLSFCFLSFWCTGTFDLHIIIPLSSVAAFILAWFQKRENVRAANK